MIVERRQNTGLVLSPLILILLHLAILQRPMLLISLPKCRLYRRRPEAALYHRTAHIQNSGQCTGTFLVLLIQNFQLSRVRSDRLAKVS
uniref:Putative secreted protein n=1 Tax=Panstrongylus lignarius TaxID=156445 RepID=A0A224XRW4_9HEMI